MIENQIYYSANAERLFEAYEGLSPATLYPEHVDAVLARAGGSALDIGAGSGRDAGWLASLGYKVTACEPNDTLRSMAIAKHGDDIDWHSADLPDLKGISPPSDGFDVVFCNGVLMHVQPDRRREAIERMHSLLSDNGVLCLNFRAVVAADEGRGMYPIHLDEIRQHAECLGLGFTASTIGDFLGRGEIAWWSCSVPVRIPDRCLEKSPSSGM